MNLFLKAKIVEKHGTQADFAKALRIDESIVSRVIRYRKELDFDEKKRWAKSLDCPVEKIFPKECADTAAV
jgi:hypothetical protein